MKLFLFFLSLFVFTSLFAQTTNVQRYGDRVFVSNVLESIYGESGSKIIENEIFNKSHIFGGPCDPYSQSLIENSKGKMEIRGGKEKCNSNFFAEYKTPSFVENSTLRSGALMKACKKLSSCTPCINHGLRRASILKEQEVSKDALKRIHELFYPIDSKLNFEKIYSSFQNFEGALKQSWEFYFEYFCKTEEWQIL